MNKQSLSGAHAAGFAIFCAAKPASAGHHDLRAKAVKEDDSVERIIYNSCLLYTSGIASTLKKLPTELVRSCSTGLYLRTDDIQRVKAVLSGKQIAPGGIYLIRRSADGQKGYGKVR